MPLGCPPPAPSMCALVARCWVGVPPLPSPPLRPLASGARNRSGGSLYSVASSTVSFSLHVLLGVLSPLSVLDGDLINGAGLALTGPPTVAARAAPVSCAGEYPGLFGFPPRPVRALLTGPPVATAEATLVGCSAGLPALSVCCSAPASASMSSIAATPHGVAPSPPLVGCSQLGWSVGGFSSPPPPPASVLPQSGSGRCGGSQGFDSLGPPNLSGSQVVP